MTILSQLHIAVNSGKTLQQAIDEIIPGADPKFWESRVKNYDSDAPTPKRKTRRRSRSRKPSKRINYAACALASSSPFDDGLKATARRRDELSAQTPAPRRIPWFVNGKIKKMLEVI